MTTDVLSREAAWRLLTEWTQSESLRKHALAVEAAVRGYARAFGEDENAARTIPSAAVRNYGADELGVPLETHLANVISFVREQADVLGLRGTFA